MKSNCCIFHENRQVNGKEVFPISEHPFYQTSYKSVYSVNSLTEELQQQLKHPEKRNNQPKPDHLKKQPPGNYVSTLVMLTKPSDSNQACATGTIIRHLSQNILKKLNNEYSMSEFPLGVTDLLKVLCPCKGTFTLLQVISILPSLFNTASYTLNIGTDNTVIKEIMTCLRCSLQELCGLETFFSSLTSTKIRAMRAFMPPLSPPEEKEQDASSPLAICCYATAVPVFF